ncbi:MAG: sigma-70 family RNA polymerase sigma factor [Pseudonocardiaceae bacterium]|nr:MAG: sigma-70 family RNA polymerase sigma factor [Pseudonocardiaceae bacterium]
MYRERQPLSADEPDPGTGADDSRIDRLVGPAQAGDAAALSELMELVRPLVVRYCSTRVRGSTISPEDVAQEVCVALLKSLPRYRSRGRPFLAFVHSVAGHRLANAFTSAARRHEFATADLPPDSIRCDPREQPEQHLLDELMAGEVGLLLRRLPAERRDILVLRIAWGMSVRDTAAVLGLTPERVRLLQHRALNSLRHSLFDTRRGRRGQR